MNNIIPCVDFSVELFEDVALSKVSRLASGPEVRPCHGMRQSFVPL